NFDRHKPLFNNNIGKPLDLTIFQFLFTNYIDGLGSLVGRIFSADSSSKRIFYTNRLLLAYFFQAAGIQENYNRVVLEVPDVSKYILTTEKFEKWAKENCYCLEMIVPGSWTNEKIDSWMLKEFNQCLNVHISVEYRVVPCWVLNKVGENMVDPNKEISLDYQGTKEKQWINYNNPKSLKDSLKEYKFANLNRLMTALNMQKVGRPLVPIVLDETSDSSNMNISLRLKNIQDLPATSTALKKYGFKLEPALRKIKMLVIRE
ncbi:MAG TPA: hypothetical protein VL053_02985, partial [Arachidicoccus sp.]|nr:hypothetical protein [Arachidicoccus sp.]